MDHVITDATTGITTTVPFTDAEVAAWTAAQAMLAKVVPASVHMWQAKVALASAGKLDAANAAVAASGNVALQTAWALAPEISRASPSVAAMGAAIGMQAADLDALFIAADKIAV